MSTLLTLDTVHKHFHNNHVVRGVSLELEEGAIGCFLGASGCGKTTLLRMVAGFETLDDGRILIDGDAVANAHRILPPEDRNIGMVFQDYALFPHLSVLDNVQFGLHRIKKSDGASKNNRAMDMIALVGLKGTENKFPHELSGGQQQRVALARALAPRPRLLLMDEPFSNLDVALRERLSAEVREIVRSEGITALMVTHNQHEAFAMADRVGVIHNGVLQQWDTPYALYTAPLTPYVASFVGEGTLLKGIVSSSGTLQTALGELQGLWANTATLPKQESAGIALVRPDAICVAKDQKPNATISTITYRGDACLYTVRLHSGETLLATQSTLLHPRMEPGTEVNVTPCSNSFSLFLDQQPA